MQIKTIVKCHCIYIWQKLRHLIIPSVGKDVAPVSLPVLGKKISATMVASSLSHLQFNQCVYHLRN